MSDTPAQPLASPPLRQLPLPPQRALRWVHVDEAVIAVDKPAGLLSVPGRGAAGADCASAQVQAAYPDALIVHRLDMGTSGLLVFARGAEAQRRLSQAFAERLADKHYIAVVAGLVQGDVGEVDLPVITDWPNRPRQKVCHATGKPSQTRWQVLQREPARHPALGGCTRVALQPLTGRSHQLRLHLQALGHPILGDELYAPPDAVMAAERLLLHAARLTLPHPLSGTPLTLETPPEF